MTYENAPATILLATRCACCHRALVDAVSVERGVGPDCAEKYGYGATPQGEPDFLLAASVMAAAGWHQQDVAAIIGTDPRAACNQLVRFLAQESFDKLLAEGALRAIAALGFAKLADKAARINRVRLDKLQHRAAPVAARPVAIVTGGGRIVVRTPYADSDTFRAFLAAVRMIPGRKWDRVSKAWSVPADAKRALWTALQTSYAGAPLTVDGADKGTVPARAAA